MIQRFDCDRQWQQIVDDSPAMGALPRQTKYGEAPGLLPFGEAYPDKLVDVADFKDVIQHCHEHEIFPIFHQKKTWAANNLRWNQDGLGFCTTEDTDVLTNRGWVKWPECRDGDLLGTINQTTHALEFQQPQARQVFEYDGEMIYSTNRRADFGVTPNHRMYVRKFDNQNRTLSNRYQFVQAKDLGWYAGLLNAPSGFLGTELVEVAVPGDRTYDGDDFLALLAMVVADGYAGGSENTKNWVSFCCFDPLQYDRVAALAGRVGFRETPSRRGVFVRYDAGPLAEWMRRNCYSGMVDALNKTIPDIVKWVSHRQIKYFLMWYGDQSHKHPLTAFYSSSHKIIDDLQELLLRIGKRSTPSWNEAKISTLKNGQVAHGNKACTLCVSKTNRLCLDHRKHIEQDRYKGLVYCATVPNGTLVTRRNGSVLISGNCWAWGVTASMMDCRAREGKPTVLLSPISLGWLVGWRNRGNYLESAMQGATERGICAMEFTPDMHSLSYKNYKSGWEADALNYRIAEAWDTDARNMIQHALSVLRTGTPLYIAYNWWGHALQCCGLRWDESQTNNIVWQIRNSHNEDDTIELTGNRGVPDEAYGVRATLTEV